MDEKDLDRQMGELDGKDAEKLDEQIWGSDEEEEEEEKKVWIVLIWAKKFLFYILTLSDFCTDISVRKW